MSDSDNALELAIMCGLPRSGKTTVAKRLEARGYVRVSPDDIRLALHGQQFLASAEGFVWATAETMARALLLGERKVVIDATNSTYERRAQWVRMAHDFGLQPDIYLTETPLDVCLVRNNGYIPADVIVRMHKQYERPTHNEGRLLRAVEGAGVAVLSCECGSCRVLAAIPEAWKAPRATFPK